MERFFLELGLSKDQVPILLSSLALILSLAGLVISFAAFYTNVLKQARLRILLGDQLGMVYEEIHGKTNPDEGEKKPEKLHTALYLYVVILNEGARHGALIEMTGTISNLSNGESIPFEWRSFTEAKDISSTHEHFQTKRDFTGWVMPLAFPGRESVTKQIRFRSSPARFEAARYQLDITGRTYPKRRWIFGKSLIGQTRYFNLGQGEVQSLDAMSQRGGLNTIIDVTFEKTK